MLVSCIALSLLGSRGAINARGVPPLDFKIAWIEPFFGLANLFLLALMWGHGLESRCNILISLNLVSVFPAFAIVNLRESRPHPGSHGGWISVFVSSPLEFCIIQTALVTCVFVAIQFVRFSLELGWHRELTKPLPGHRLSIKDMLLIVSLVAIQCLSFRLISMWGAI